MKKKAIWILIIGVVLTMGVTKVRADMVKNPGKGVLWLENFKTLTIDPSGYKGWRITGSKNKSFTSDGKKAKLVGGVATRYISYDYETINTPEEYPYLQVNIADVSPNFVWMIQSGNGLWSTGYVSKGKKGIFTFDFKTFMLHGRIPSYWKPKKKKKGIPARGMDALNLRACSGGFIEFAWLRMVSQPRDGVILKLIDQGTPPDVINIGDKVKIEVMLTAPAKGITVTFANLAGFNRVEPFSFDGEISKKLYDDGTHGDLIPGDNVWVAEFPVTRMADNIKTGKGRILVTADISGGKTEKTSTIIPYAVDTIISE